MLRPTNVYYIDNIDNPTVNRKGRDSFNKTGASFGRSLRFRERVKTEIPGPGT